MGQQCFCGLLLHAASCQLLLQLPVCCCSYVPETDEYLAEIGHLWEAENEPDLEQEVSMLASDFSGLDAANNQTGEDEQEGAPAPRDGDEDDSAGPNDEAAQLGKFFGGDL